MNKNSTSENEQVSDSLKLIVSTSIFTFVIILLARVSFYLYRIIIARNFGPAIYGSFSLASIIFSFVVFFSLFGFHEGILRFIPLYRETKKIENIKYLLRFSTLILSISGILFGLILFFSAKFISINIFHDTNLIVFLKILSIAIPFYVLGAVFLSLIRGFEKIKTNSFISEFFQNSVKLISLLLLVFFGIKANSIAISYLIGIAAAFFLAYVYCRFKLPKVFEKYFLKKEKKIQVRKKFLFYSIPLVFSGILYDIFGYTDSSVIGFFKDSTSVGIYNAAFPIAILLSFFPSLFLQIFFPMIIRQFSKKKIEVMRELSKQVQKWILIINLPLFSLMFLFSGAFINLLFGSQYMGAEQALRILSIGFLFYSMTQILENLILVIGKSKTFLINLIIISVFNLVLNILLVPKYGINGAAFSTTISYIIMSAILFFQVKHYINITPLRRKMVRIFISVIIPLLILFYVKNFIPINLVSMILLGILFIFIYLLLILLTKSLDRNDFEILEIFKNKITGITNKKDTKEIKN